MERVESNDITTSCETLKETTLSGFRHIDIVLPRRSCTHMPSETQRMSQSETMAKRNDITTSCETLKKTTLSRFSHRHGDFSAPTVVHTHMLSETQRMSQSETIAMRNDITTSCVTLKKITFSSFPYRHFETRGKLQTQDETCWSCKTSISYKTSSDFDTLTPSKTTCFAASLIDRAKPETRNYTRRSIKSSISCETSSNFDTW